MMEITADRDRCIGAGHCALTAPDVFDSADDGLVRLRTGRVDERHRADVAEAVALCPAGALALREASGPVEHP